MKRLHRKDLYCWSEFNETNNIDFNSFLWVREGGNVLIDPLPLSIHDETHLHEFGAVAMIVLTNADHVRAAERLAELTGAEILGPAGEQGRFPIDCARWLQNGDEVVPGLVVLEMAGSKTPGELALLLQGTTLITGDLIRSHEGGRLCLLPDGKLSDKTKALASVKRLLDLPLLEALLPGDGWPVFRDAKARLKELLNHK